MFPLPQASSTVVKQDLEKKKTDKAVGVCWENYTQARSLRDKWTKMEEKKLSTGFETFILKHFLMGPNDISSHFLSCPVYGGPSYEKIRGLKPDALLTL